MYFNTLLLSILIIIAIIVRNNWLEDIDYFHRISRDTYLCFKLAEVVIDLKVFTLNFKVRGLVSNINPYTYTALLIDNNTHHHLEYVTR